MSLFVAIVGVWAAGSAPVDASACHLLCPCKPRPCEWGVPLVYPHLPPSHVYSARRPSYPRAFGASVAGFHAQYPNELFVATSPPCLAQSLLAFFRSPFCFASPTGDRNRSQIETHSKN
jgi:hypothetical protein